MDVPGYERAAGRAMPFTVVDESGERADLAERLETKFLFERADVSILRAALRRFARPIRYAGPVSVVHSVYFDDARLSACRANLDGIGVRQKARVRWYDRDTPEAVCWFELKWRRHQATGKLRYRIEGPSPLAQQPLAALPQGLAPALAERCRPVIDALTDAVLLVQYRREHFAVGEARVTLDYDLRFTPLLGRRHLTRRFAERLPDHALVECKTPLHEGGALTALMKALRARPTRFSKYVTGCQRLGYVDAG